MTRPPYLALGTDTLSDQRTKALHLIADPTVDLRVKEALLDLADRTSDELARREAAARTA